MLEPSRLQPRERILFGEIECWCRGCSRWFRSVVEFDNHRTGEYTFEAPKFGRSCRAKPNESAGFSTRRDAK